MEEVFVWRKVVDQLQLALQKRKTTINQDETDGPTNATAALIESTGKTCLIIGIGASHKEIQAVLGDIDIFAGSPFFMTAQVNLTVKQAGIYTIDVGELIETAWSHLQTIEEELSKTGTPPKTDSPLAQWYVYKAGHLLTITKDQPSSQPEALKGCVSLNELYKDMDGTLQLARGQLDPTMVQGLAIFGYTSSYE